MEPFALFNLLKSFLSQTENSAPSPTPTATVSSASANDGVPHPTERAEKVSPANEPKQNGEPKDPPQNYCLEFIRRHEERAGRRKR